MPAARHRPRRSGQRGRSLPGAAQPHDGMARPADITAPLIPQLDTPPTWRNGRMTETLSTQWVVTHLPSC